MRSLSGLALRGAALALLFLPASLALGGQQKPPPAPKLPRPAPLGRGDALERDSATGELHKVPRRRPASGAAPAIPDPATIRTRTTLVEVNCTVLVPGGATLHGLAREDFRVFEDGAEQSIAHFGASSEPASIALVVDASPSVFRELAEMRGAARSLAAALAPQDEVAVVAFAGQAHLLLPFSRDRALLERALASPPLAQVENSSLSNIYQAVYLTARELFHDRSGRKAIVLLTDGQDSGLGLSWDPASASPRSGVSASRLTFDDVARELASVGIELYAISTQTRPDSMTDAWLAAHRAEMLITPAAREQGMAHYTLYLAELVRRAGGRLYFLREIGTLGDVYRRIAEALSTQYTLGYYPSAGLAHPGWRSLRVELTRPAPGARLIHRAAYYVPAWQ